MIDHRWESLIELDDKQLREGQAQVFVKNRRPFVVRSKFVKKEKFYQWDFDFFNNKYANELVVVTDNWLIKDANYRKLKLADYLAYCRNREGSAISHFEINQRPFYLSNFNPFLKHTDLQEDVITPAYFDNLFTQLKGAFYQWYIENFQWIFIGPEGTISDLHYDLWGSHAWTTQIVGEKEVYLLPQEFSAKIGFGKANLFCKDDASFEVKDALSGFHGKILQGDLLFIPAFWWHTVKANSSSITLTQNFIQTENFGGFLSLILKDFSSFSRLIQNTQVKEILGSK